MRVLTFTIALLFLATLSRADLIELTDGTTISGTMSRQDTRVQITADDGSTRVVAPGEIKSVVLTSHVAPADAAKAQWDLDRATIAKMTDLTAIVTLHQRFLARYANQPAAKDAQQSLDQYQQLVNEGAVYFQGKWMPPADVDAIKQGWADQAQAALTDYQNGDMKASITDANSALKSDPNNPTAQMVLGMAQLQSNGFFLARQAFAKVVASDPSNMVALNDMAIVASRQNQVREALNEYTRAIQLAPDNRMLLDNIAEEIRLQGNTTDSAARHLNGLWQNAEKKIEPTMAQQNLYRWGAGWLTKEQKDSMESMISTVQSQINTLQKKLDADTAEVNTLNSEISDNQREYADAQAEEDSAQSMADCSRLSQEYDNLMSQLNDAQARVNDDQTQAQPLQSQMNKLQNVGFTGVQRVMNLGDGTNPPAPLEMTIPTPN